MNKNLNTGNRRYVLIFILPAVLLLGTFLLFSVILSFGFSFYEFNLLRAADAYFTGLDNYVRLFQDPTFFKALFNSLYFMVVVVIYQVSLAFLLALLVRPDIKLIGIYRTAYFTPLVTSITVVAILWTFIYNPNPTQGLLNALFVKIGFPTSEFLNNQKTAMNSIIFMSGWHSAGYQMMILLAGLQAIPKELYEAASIDGANAFGRFFHITLPGIKNILVFVVQITAIAAMKLFTQPYIMTRGGPNETTKTLTFYIYEQGFQYRNMGYASSISVSFFVIVVSISLGIRQLMRAR